VALLHLRSDNDAEFWSVAPQLLAKSTGKPSQLPLDLNLARSRHLVDALCAAQETAAPPAQPPRVIDLDAAPAAAPSHKKGGGVADGNTRALLAVHVLLNIVLQQGTVADGQQPLPSGPGFESASVLALNVRALRALLALADASPGPAAAPTPTPSPSRPVPAASANPKGSASPLAQASLAVLAQLAAQIDLSGGRYASHLSRSDFNMALAVFLIACSISSAATSVS
jgi:hypothetical protein